MERVKTGIPGMDELLGGGFLPGSLVLVVGVPGAGKTVFCSQFLYNGAVQYGEAGVFVNFEEPAQKLYEHLAVFGMNFKGVEKQLKVVTFDPRRYADLKELLRIEVSRANAKRVVLDSIAAWGLYFEVSRLRRELFELGLWMREQNCTLLFTSETPVGTARLSRFGVEEFVADCIIVLNYVRREKVFERTVQVWKMRGSDHSRAVHPFEIGPKGIVVHASEIAI